MFLLFMFLFLVLKKTSRLDVISIYFSSVVLTYFFFILEKPDLFILYLNPKVKFVCVT